MGFRCGIIGLPNVGKSTLFNGLTKAGVEAANFPFCTIEPNTGVVPVPDQRLHKLAEIVNPKRILPTTMEFVDIAGLVKGASKGEGLGNQFLSNIRTMDAIGHVVRCFEDDNIIHVETAINPIRDIDIINTELAIADLEVCERTIARLKKREKGGDNAATFELRVLDKCRAHLEQLRLLRLLHLDKEELAAIDYLNFLTEKPVMYIANLSENNSGDNPYLNQVYQLAKQEEAVVVPICATIESDLAELDDTECSEFMQALEIKQLGLDSVIQTGYKLLNLQTYFTAGVKEVRAWTISAGSTAPQAAGKIHTDFEKGFIRAQTISFNDFIKYGGEQGAKEAGKMRSEGKDYIVQDGDIINFLFNA